MALSNAKQNFDQNSENGVRSLSQSTFFGTKCLPPLNPFPPSESSLASSNTILKDASMEEIDVSSHGPLLPPSLLRENVFRGNDSLPPRKGHRRSNSDVPLGFSAMIQSSPQLVPISGQGIPGRTVYLRENPGNDKPFRLKRYEMQTISDAKSNIEGIDERKTEGEVVDDMVNSLMNLDSAGKPSGVEDKDKDSIGSGTKNSGGDSSNTESESISRHGISSREGVKRSAAGDIAPPARHFRSLSMDSAFGNLQFGEESPKLPMSGNRSGQLSPSNPVSENLAKINLDFAHGEFNEIELKKIMADERLAEIAFSDPKRAKRILANRQSAARSKERKLYYISELERKVQTLQTEATTLSTQITMLQKDYAELTNQNNELKFRLQSMQQQAQLRDALHEALTGEVQRLKLVNMELRDEGRTSNCTGQQIPIKQHMFQLLRQPTNQLQRSSVPTSTSSTSSAAPTSA